MPRSPLPISALLVLCLTTHAEADWSPAGIPVCVSPGDQGTPALTVDPTTGDLVLLWVDDRLGPWDVFGQRLQPSSAVALGWPTDGKLIAHNGVWPPDLLTVAPGQFFAALVSSPGADVYSQMFNGAGDPNPGWTVNGLLVAGGAGEQRDPSSAADGVGGAFVAWDDVGGLSVRLIRLNADASTAAGWPAAGLQLSLPGGNAIQANCIADGSGGAFITWQETRDGQATFYPYLVRVTGDGQLAPGWPAGGVRVAQHGKHIDRPRLAPDGTGGVYCAWADWRSAPPGASYVFQFEYFDIYAQHVLADGTVAPGWPASGVPVCTTPQRQQNPLIISDGTGGAIIAWYDGRGLGNFAQRLTSAGTIAPGWQPNGSQIIAGGQAYLWGALVTDGNGGAYAAGGESSACRVQHLMSDGTYAPLFGPSGRPVADPVFGGGKTDVNAVADQHGGVYLAWADSRPSNNGSYNIWAQHFDGDLPTAITASLVSATPRGSTVHLVWSTIGVSTGELERREASSEWRRVASISADGTGSLTFDDADVLPGHSYGYRMRCSGASESFTTPDVWVTVPAYSLSLAGLTPNPARMGQGAIAFTLPREAAGELTVFDVTGRQVMRMDLVGLGAGAHVIPFAQGASTQPGVYWLNLRQGNEQRVARAVILR